MVGSAHHEPAGFGRATALVAALSGLGVAALWLFEPAFSASATALLDGAAGGTSPLGVVGKALAKGASGGHLRALWGGFAGLNAALAVVLVRVFGGGRLSWLTAGLWLVLIPDVFLVIGVEAPLLFMTQLALLAGALAERRPAVAATLLATSLAGAALLSPLGLLAAPGLALIAALFPRPPADGAAGDAAATATSLPGVAARPVALPWLAGTLGGVAVLRVALPGPVAGVWWTANLAALRAPAPALVVMGWGDLPAVGDLLTIAAMLPVVPLLLALAPSPTRPPSGPAGPPVRPVRQRRWPGAGALAAAALWWLIIGMTVDASDRLLADPRALITPLLLIAGLPSARLWLAALAPTQPESTAATPAARPRGGWLLVIALAGALLLAAAADRAGRGDPRSALGRALPVAEDPTALLPTVLLPSDRALLRQHKQPACVFPDRRGSHGLIDAMRRLKLTTVRDWDAFTAPTVLVHQPPIGPIARGWRALLPMIACTADACLLDHRPKPAPARRQP